MNFIFINYLISNSFSLAPGTQVRCTRPGLFAFTFDDGPSETLPKLLDKLDQLNVKATFFVNGQNMNNEIFMFWISAFQ